MTSSDEKVELSLENEEFVTSGIEEDRIKIDAHTGVYDGVQRKMKQRHIQMIALAGTLGTGLFLGSGKAIAYAGPAGALIAYTHVGTIVYCMLMSLGEMMCYMPISGGYVHFATRFLDPALGFALGWLQWYGGIVTLPAEIIGATLIITFWDSGPNGSGLSIPHMAGYITLLLFLCITVNFLGVRWFGESEFMFAIIKIMLVIGCVVGGLIIDLGGAPGHDRIGFRYWKNPGAFAPFIEPGNTGKFLGWFQTLLQAAYSYLGMESIAMAAAEVQNPRRALPKAVKRVFYRILAFYVLATLIVGMLVPYTDPQLLQSTGNAASSPFVLAMTRLRTAVINAAVLTSAFSAANSLLYFSSRQLYGLALRGQAPRIFAKTTKDGLPITALAFTSVWILLAYMALSQGASTVLNWMSNLIAILGFATWAIISLTYIRFYHGLKHQGIDRSKFGYYNRWQPFPAYWALIWSIIIILFNGWPVFLKGAWKSTDFVIAYINIPIFVVLYGAYKIIRKSSIVTLEAMDFHSNVPTPEMVDFEAATPKTLAGRFAKWLF
ncbi:amino acid permease/ SLC12A domain-containing protein [Mycena olivaceomarginata]|nr:amino acid permease/ SLC12A domain-containing protein [Mycena olivaceomarginata]